MSDLFSESEKAALWDLLDSRRIHIGPRGWDYKGGFDATAMIDCGDEIECISAEGKTAKEAVENLMQKMEGSNEIQCAVQ